MLVLLDAVVVQSVLSGAGNRCTGAMGGCCGAPLALPKDSELKQLTGFFSRPFGFYAGRIILDLIDFCKSISEATGSTDPIVAARRLRSS